MSRLIKFHKNELIASIRFIQFGNRSVMELSTHVTGVKAVGFGVEMSAQQPLWMSVTLLNRTFDVEFFGT